MHRYLVKFYDKEGELIYKRMVTASSRTAAINDSTSYMRQDQLERYRDGGSAVPFRGLEKLDQAEEEPRKERRTMQRDDSDIEAAYDAADEAARAEAEAQLVQIAAPIMAGLLFGLNWPDEDALRDAARVSAAAAAELLLAVQKEV